MIFFIFVLGLILGSFLNSIIYRTAAGGSVFASRSQCPHCGRKLGFWDLIPLVSFIALRGRCRYCGQKISWQYPLVELATAATFLMVYLNNVIPAQAGIQGIGAENWILTFVRMTDWMNIIFQLIFVSFLIVIFVFDLKHYLILDRFVYPGIFLAAFYQILADRFGEAVLGAGLLAGFFALLYFVSRGRWIGFGDVKLGIFLGLLVPWPQTLVLFFLAYFLGALTGLLLMAYGLKSLKDRLPFGAFLTLAAFIAMLWGEEWIQWYFQLIGLR